MLVESLFLFLMVDCIVSYVTRSIKIPAVCLALNWRIFITFTCITAYTTFTIGASIILFGFGLTVRWTVA